MSKLVVAALAAAVAVLPMAGSAVAKDWKTLRVATEGAYPPFNSQTPDGKVIGFEPDLLVEICKRAELTCETVIQEWKGIIPGLLAGKYDAIMSGMSITEKRLEVIDFSIPYTNSGNTFAVLKDSPLIKALGEDKRVPMQDEAAVKAAVEGATKAMQGKLLAVQTSTIQADFAKNYLKDVKSRVYETTKEEDLDLLSGRVDAVFASTSSLVSTLEQADGKIVLAGPKFFGGIFGLGSGFGIAKGQPELKAKLDKAIQSTIDDGTVKALAMKWFKVDTTPTKQ
jgi:octopine/nopaline transport system substrate-binding protein